MIAEIDPLRELFDSILDDETERKIMKMIIDGKTTDEIIDNLLGISKGDIR